MNSTVQPVYKNLRYRLLHVNDKIYLVDLDSLFLVYFFPFIFWLLPQRIYVIEGQEIAEKLKAPNIKKEKMKIAPLLGGGISVFLANLIRPFTDYFDLSTTWVLNCIIIFIICSTALFLRFFFSKLFKKNLQKKVNLELLPTEVIRIRPQSIIHIFKFIGAYILSVLLIYSMGYTFVDSGNAMILLIFFFFLSIFLIINSFTVILTDYKVTFVNKKHK